MSYTNEEGRTQLLDELAAAVDQLAAALAALGEAYEHVDEHAAETLEQGMFRPIQVAYARARRTHTEFAVRHGLSQRSFEAGSSGLHSADPRVYLDRAVEAAAQADGLLAELQDSLLPVEVGDPQVREGLREVRELISPVGARGHDLLRTLGR